MNRIDSIFAALRAQGRKALMPFVCGGHPYAGACAAMLPALERAGASIVEIGVPFSDPIADGPVIAAAMHEALGGGSHRPMAGPGHTPLPRPMPTTPMAVFDEVASVRAKVRLGLVAMCSVSIVQRMGPGSANTDSAKTGSGFIDLAARAGFDGVIFPDAPLEESGDLLAAAKKAGLAASLLIAPTTPPDRAARIAQASSGFVYLLARSGITGETGQTPDIADRVAALRKVTPLPIACGFGLSTAEHVRQVVRHADAAIVGSALVRRIGDAHAAGGDPIAEAERFTRELAGGLA